MRFLFFIIFSIIATQNVSAYQPYPYNNGPNLLDQDSQQDDNQNNDSPKKKKVFFKIDINNPILKLIVISGAFGYLVYDSLCEWWSSSDNSQNTLAPKTPEPILKNEYYTVEIDGHTIAMTEQEYVAYKKSWYKSDYFVENYQKFYSEGRIGSNKSLPQQPKIEQQKPNDSKQLQEEKPEVTPEKEQKYLIVRKRCQKDLAEFQDYNQITRCWIEKVVDQREVPNRYKKDFTVLSNDVFEMHEFNTHELQDYIKEHNLGPGDWGTLYGNGIQKEIHLDSIQLLRQSSQPFKSIWMRENITELVQTIDAGRALNADGYCTKATKVNNFCAALMDYATAAWDGYKGGIQNRIPETIVQGALFVGTIAVAVFVPGAAEAMLCYSAFQLGADIGYTLSLATSGYERDRNELSTRFKAITDRFKGISNGTYTFEHSVQDFACVGGEANADYILMKSSGKLIKHAKKAAQKLRKYYRKHHGELIVATPDGQILKVIDESTNDNFSSKKSDKKSGGGKNNNQSNIVNNSDKNNEGLEWAKDYQKHRPKKGLSWKEVIEGTRHGAAKYTHDVNIEMLEREGWQRGIPSKKHSRMKVMDWNKIIGASEGIETQYSRIEMSGNTIHGYPITYEEYRRHLKG